MLNQLYCKLNALKIQSQLLNWYKFIQPLYEQYVPYSIRHRRNVHYCKLDDVSVVGKLNLKLSLNFVFTTF